MNIKELLLSLDKDELFRCYLDTFENGYSSETSYQVRFDDFIKDIKATEPVLSQSMVCVQPCSDGNYDTFIRQPGDDEKYSLLYIKWEEILGYMADEESISLCGKLNYAVCVIYEMTWFGFTNEENEQAIKDNENDIGDTEEITDLEGFFASFESDEDNYSDKPL